MELMGPVVYQIELNESQIQDDIIPRTILKAS